MSRICFDRLRSILYITNTYASCGQNLQPNFELAAVMYGKTISPYNTICSLCLCAGDNYNIFENDNMAITIRNSILNGFSVDEYFESFNSLEEPGSCTHDVDAILRQGQFILAKWNSNCAERLDITTDA